ncbi:chymotrypsin-like protease CTRL-1 [Oppia nitens]|uniref:chymotrypsin-like protease CTRL-1 n=1 Tax=Oppia nitens TaxID=1686743 RepID=UPI0023DAA363|nr:chymotrypsin-like protease CTRL-1 [Oppia nitens]
MLIVLVNGLHSRIKQYPNVTLDTCGIGRQSSLLLSTTTTTTTTTGRQCFKWSTNETSSVQNGRLALPGEFPWIAYIEGSEYFWGFWRTKTPDRTDNVRTVQDLRQSGHTYGVDKWFIHPNWSSTEKFKRGYDIAIVKLKSQIPIPTTTIPTPGLWFGQQINGICLPEPNIMNTEQELALIAGYGSTTGDDVRNTGQLKMGWTVIAKPYDTTYPYTNIIVVFRYPHNTGAAMCYGDSGGPLIQFVGNRAVLIGIQSGISGTVGRCLSRQSDSKMAFIRLSSAVQWIVNTINSNQ